MPARRRNEFTPETGAIELLSGVYFIIYLVNTINTTRE